MDTPVGCAVNPIRECIIRNRARLCCIGRSLFVRDVTRRSTGRSLSLRSFRRFCSYCGGSSTLKATNRRTLISRFATHRLRACHGILNPPRKIELRTDTPPLSNRRFKKAQKRRVDHREYARYQPGQLRKISKELLSCGSDTGRGLSVWKYFL